MKTSEQIRKLNKDCEETPDHICDQYKCAGCPLVQKSIKKWGIDLLRL